MTAQNPLIGDTTADTINNVSEALGALVVLMAHDHSGIVRLMEPMLHALEHASQHE